MNLNKYITVGEITTIVIKQMNGDIHHVLIDTEDLEKVKIHNWHVRHSVTNGEYYVNATASLEYSKKHSKTILLHRLIMGVTDTFIYVDHINHDGLDNRRENLRITSNEQNGQNRKGKNCNNKSGYRNVSQQGKWWVVQIVVDGKNTVLKKFPLDKVDEAGAYAELMRNKYYGAFAGVS